MQKFSDIVDWTKRGLQRPPRFRRLLLFVARHPVWWLKIKLMHPRCGYRYVIGIMEDDLTEEEVEWLEKGW